MRDYNKPLLFPAHRDIAHSTPLPLGEGQGGGAACCVLFLIFHPPLHRSIHNLIHAVENLIDITLF